MAVELLSNRDDVSAAAHRLTAIAQHQVRAFDRPPYVDRPGSNLGGQIQRQKEGVAHRVIYDRTAVAWPGRLHGDIIPSLRAGEQSRVHSELPLKIVIADDHAAIIPFSLAPGGQGAAYLVHQSPLLVALAALFETYWERATPVSAAEGEQGPEFDELMTDHLDEDTRTLLTLLAAGLTDAAIARAQGWSERTTQRRVHQLMRRLGAVTRFQASLIAVKRGWL
jgi:DNA-binding NarL/FixJ family response regulator